MLSAPWAIYQGTPYKAGGAGFTILHLPSGTFYVTLAAEGDCKRLLRELTALRIRWDEADPRKVTGPDALRAERLVQCYLEAE